MKITVRNKTLAKELSTFVERYRNAKEARK
jgi:hypothetical protein